jgi:ferredoxin
VEIDLASVDGVVLAMNDDNVTKVSKQAVPLTHQGDSHGPSKGGNYPQKSLAVLMGLGQFGVSRIVFRDELVDGVVKRFVGPLRSIIVFDEEEPVRDGGGGVMYPTEEWRRFLFRLYDFTDVDPALNKHRSCSYIPLDDEGCGKCVDACPSGAQESSVSMPDGGYSESVSKQVHRFYDGKLQFDNAKCCETRGRWRTCSRSGRVRGVSRSVQLRGTGGDPPPRTLRQRGVSSPCRQARSNRRCL